MARCNLYQIRRAYYNGTFYDQYPSLISSLKLYSGIRQIFSPLRRAVRVDVARIPGKWLFAPDVPLAIQVAVKQIRLWSTHDAAYSRAVLHGAVAGEFGLFVVDDWQASQVRIVPLRPDEVVLGNLPSGEPYGMVIKCNQLDAMGVYEYAQVITTSECRTYRNGVLWSYDGGDPIRPNELETIPIFLSPYVIGEDGVGECAFSGAAEVLNRVNDMVSQSLDVLQRNAEPPVIFSGVDSADIGTNDNTVVLGPADAKAYTLAPNLVISDAMPLIERAMAEFKNLLPQLSIDILAARNDLAYATVLILLGELVDHVQDVRVSVDRAIVQAERLALQAAQLMRIIPTGLNPALHHLDSDRPVIAPPPTPVVAKPIAAMDRAIVPDTTASLPQQELIHA
jgi:hypothetical protein